MTIPAPISNARAAEISAIQRKMDAHPATVQPLQPHEALILLDEIRVLRAALQPFAMIGKNLPAHWRGNVPLKQQVGYNAALVNEYRTAAQVYYFLPVSND